MRIEVLFDDHVLADFARALEQLSGTQGKRVLTQALNHSGRVARTQVVRNLTQQTGLRRRTIVAAVREKKASALDLTHRLRTRGGDISLKFFSPRESRRGVRVRAPGGSQRVANAFTKGGRFPNRVDINMGGHVFRNAAGGAWGGPVELLDSGVVIPNEMVRGATREAWDNVVGSHLPRRLQHELQRRLPR